MLQSREIVESDVVDILRQSSDEFRDFYDNERSKIGYIKWCFAPNLSKKYAADAAHTANSEGKCHTICLTRFPVQINDARLVAHEMGHAIMAEEKKTLAIRDCGNLNPPLATYLVSMLEDPIVESLLQEYHFNLLTDYLHWMSNQAQIYKNQREPFAPRYQIANAFYLANKMMCWKLIENPKMRRRWFNFLFWYSNPRRCPTICSLGQELVSIMDRVGLTTPDQRKDVFLEVKKKYNLEKYFQY